MKSRPDPHYRHRFPAGIISHAVWLYHVFGPSFRDVELLLVLSAIAPIWSDLSGRASRTIWVSVEDGEDAVPGM